MGINRVQFQPGLSMSEFIHRYGTEAKCYRALYKWRWPEGFRCPACAGRARSRFRRGDAIYYQCRACRHQTTLTAGTLFEGTKLPLRTWMLAMHLLTSTKTNLAALELMRHLGVNYKTAWRLKHKVMQANLKRAISGTYHAVKQAKYARRYLAEAAYRFNRRLRLRETLPRLATAMMRCKPCPEPRLRIASNFHG